MAFSGKYSSGVTYQEHDNAYWRVLGVKEVPRQGMRAVFGIFANKADSEAHKNGAHTAIGREIYIYEGNPADADLKRQAYMAAKTNGPFGNCSDC